MTKEQNNNNPAHTEVENKVPASLSKSSWVVKVMVTLMRIVVGGVFVFSGFVKAIDPWGTYYKLNEYLLTMGLDSLAGLTVFGAFALAAVEFVLGVLLLTGSCRRVVPVLAALFMIVMTPLTLWLAITDAVPDCGCFGDYLVMSNWATFGKNVVLLAGTIYLVLLNKCVPSLYGPAVQWMVMLLSFILPITISVVGYFTQPMLDFRPYKIGTKLVSNATSPSDDDYVFIYARDGVEREFTIDSVPDDDSDWEFIARKAVAPSHEHDSIATGNSFAVWDNGDDVSDELVTSEQLLLILIPEIEKVNIASTFLINELQEYAYRHGVNVVGVTSASEEQIEEWNDIAMAHYPLYSADDSEIKMMARGNPAIVYARDGVVEWKRTLVSIDPQVIHDGELPVSQLADDMNPKGRLLNFVLLYLASMLAVLIVNRTHLLFGRKKDKKKT